MLYDIGEGVNAAPHSTPSSDVGFSPKVPPYKRTRRGAPLDPVSLEGLAAVTPHGANLYTSGGSSGGTNRVGAADTGAGGGGATGSTPGGTVSIVGTQGSTYKPVGRNTSPITGITRPGLVARVKYQASGQGARVSRGEAVSPITPRSGAAFPSGGLFGLDDGLSGFSFKRAITPPRAVRSIATKSFRVATTVAVGAVGGAISGGMVLGPAGILIGAAAGGTYGLGKGIYGVTSNAPQGRTLYQTLLPSFALGAGAAGATSYFSPGLVAQSEAAWSGTPAALMPSHVALSPIGAPATGLNLINTTGTASYAPSGFASASTFGSTGVPASSISTSLAIAPPPYLAPQMGLLNPTQIASAAQVGGTATAPAGGGFWSGVSNFGGGVLNKLGSAGSAATSAGWSLGSEVVKSTLPIMALRGLMGGGAQYAGEPSYNGGTSLNIAPGGAPAWGNPGFGSSGGGGVTGGDGGEPTQVAGMSTATKVVLAGVAVTALGMFLKRKRR